MTSVNASDRDEFLKALEEARRAAMGDVEDEDAAKAETATAAPSGEFLRAVERLTSRLRSYISAGFLARLYADDTPAAETQPPEPEQPEPEATTEAAPPPPPVPHSEAEAVIAELHLTPDMSIQDLARIRREFAKVNHPDRVVAPGREEATRRMTIANVVIDDALRVRKARA